MENKKVGLIIIGISILIGIIILIFNLGLKDIISQSCSHGPACEMYDTLRTQTWIGVFLLVIILGIGIFVMKSKPEEKLVVKTIKEKKRKKDYSSLDKKEKEVVDLLVKEGNAMFQADVMEKIGIGKVGMTRLLDKLEAKQIIERKRRGMNNMVVLKD